MTLEPRADSSLNIKNFQHTSQAKKILLTPWITQKALGPIFKKIKKKNDGKGTKLQGTTQYFTQISSCITRCKLLKES